MLENILKPMEPVAQKEPFDSSDFLYQIKWDGIRLLVFIGEGLRLQTRRGLDQTEKFPEQAVLRQACKAASVILDGEIVVLDPEGRPSFHGVLQRERLKKPENIKQASRSLPTAYMAFDILYLNGKDLLRVPLEERQEILAQVLTPGPYVYLVESFADGVSLFEAVCQKGLEGIVAKKKGGGYHLGGKHPDWVKVKCRRQQLCVAGGMACRGGMLSSLLAGAYRGDELLYVGSVGSGLKERERSSLLELTAKFRQEEAPFSNPPLVRRREAVWLLPVLTFYTGFLEWTDKGVMRSPCLLGFSSEPPENCILE